MPTEVEAKWVRRFGDSLIIDIELSEALDVPSTGAPVTEADLVRAVEVAASYTPIDPQGLYEGCLGPTQSHDVAMRVASQFAANGWRVVADA